MKKVDVFDEENGILINDRFSTSDFEFSPEEKKFTVSSSINDDVFYNDQKIEYKISTEPVELYMRTLESSSKPPLEYSIKDGVVLESEIKKNGHYLSSTIENLKKEVEWKKVPLLGHYEVNFFILSKHPEIISKEEYRKLLRFSIEKIKGAISRVEEALKADGKGLQIHTNEQGKHIWYPESESDKKQGEDYWNLSEEKKSESAYDKKLKHVMTLNESLFTEGSSEYVGISEYELKESDEIIEYIEKLLNNKPTSSVKKDEGVINKTTGNSWKWILVIVLSIIALSWGIWTAIGVFILGSIIIGLLSQ